VPRPNRSLLGDTTMLRAAGLLALDPTSSKSLGVLLRSMPGITRLTVIRTLNDLTAQGFILKTAGNPPQYKANQRHYLFDEIRSIAIKTFGGFESLAARIADSPGVEYAAIYGSFARATAGPDSDIDLLLVVGPGAEPDVADIVAALVDAEHSIGREINPTIYDRTEFESKRDSGFLRDVLAGPLVVLKAFP
jgi:predicted nucleotidyltransferase